MSSYGQVKEVVRNPALVAVSTLILELPTVP